MANKCECPVVGKTSKERESQYSQKEKSGMNHKPNECKGTNEVKQYLRRGEKIWLCSCCNMLGDKIS